nr:replication helicase subunit [Thorea hispida]
MPETLYHQKHFIQIPPHNNLAEEILLGGILLNIYIIQIVKIELAIESFSIETHQIIYRAIISVYSKYQYINPILLINMLWEINLLQKIGGVTKILFLLKQGQMFIPQKSSEFTILYYTNLIKEQYARRLLIQYGHYAIKLGYSCITYKNIFTKINKQLTEINYLLNKNKTTNTSILLTHILLKIKSNNLFSYDNNYLSSGFPSLDNIIYGFTNGDFIVIAGRPSMGKTSLSLNIICNSIQQYNVQIALFSLEMSQEQLLYRLLSILSQISINKIQQGNISLNEWNSLQTYSKKLLTSQLYIDDTANLSISNLIAKIKHLRQQKQIHLVVIDYLQLIYLDSSTTNINNRTEELSLITRSLKILAKELNIPIIALSQLNRNLEKRINKKPLLSDLRESGCVTSWTKLLIDVKSNLILFFSPDLLISFYTKNNSYNLSSYIKQIKNNKVIRKDIKYTYIILSQRILIIQLTHNHPILTKIGWIKSDQLKYYYNFLDHNISYQYISNIHLRKKKFVYDITMDESTSFIANHTIILHNSIEQDADLILLLYREAYYHKEITNTSITDIIIAKHRNGPIGTVQLNFNNFLSSFENLFL